MTGKASPVSPINSKPFDSTQKATNLIDWRRTSPLNHKNEEDDEFLSISDDDDDLDQKSAAMLSNFSKNLKPQA